MDAVGRVPGDKVFAYHDFRRAVDVDASCPVALVSVATRTGADAVAGKDLSAAAALQYDAVALETVHGQPTDVAAISCEGEAVDSQTRVGAVQLDEHRARAGPRLAVAVDEHWLSDGGQGRPRLYGLGTACDVELDDRTAPRVSLLDGGAERAVAVAVIAGAVRRVVGAVAGGIDHVLVRERSHGVQRKGVGRSRDGLDGGENIGPAIAEYLAIAIAILLT